VNVLYAGSLVNLMEHSLGPRFDQATGSTFQGFSAGSTELAMQIKGKAGPAEGDVFISASPAVNADLEGAANGNWVSPRANSAYKRPPPPPTSKRARKSSPNRCATEHPSFAPSAAHSPTVPTETCAGRLTPTAEQLPVREVAELPA
jgi:hypothetical protein